MIEVFYLDNYQCRWSKYFVFNKRENFKMGVILVKWLTLHATMKKITSPPVNVYEIYIFIIIYQL